VTKGLGFGKGRSEVEKFEKPCSPAAFDDKYRLVGSIANHLRASQL